MIEKGEDKTFKKIRRAVSNEAINSTCIKD